MQHLHIQATGKIQLDFLYNAVISDQALLLTHIRFYRGSLLTAAQSEILQGVMKQEGAAILICWVKSCRRQAARLPSQVTIPFLCALPFINSC